MNISPLTLDEAIAELKSMRDERETAEACVVRLAELINEIKSLRAERDAARHWRTWWKWAARRLRRHLMDYCDFQIRRAEIAETELARLANVAGEAIGTDPSLRSSACVDVLAARVETLRKDLEEERVAFIIRIQADANAYEHGRKAGLEEAEKSLKDEGKDESKIESS